MRAVVGAAMVLAAVAWPADAFAAIVATYTSLASFQAALGGQSTIVDDFESDAVNAAIQSGTSRAGAAYLFPAGVSGRVDTKYQAVGNQGLAAYRPTDPWGRDYDYFIPGDAITLEFAEPILAFSAYFDVEASALGQLYVAAAGTVAGNGAAYDTGNLYFVGLVSDTGFTTVTLGGYRPEGGFTIDSLTHVLASPIPPPAILVGVAFAGLALVRRLQFGRRAATRT